MQSHNDNTIKMSDTVLRKIYLSLYLKGLCMRRSWRPNKTATYWPPLLWPSVFLSCFPGLLNRRPGGPAFCWVLAFSTTSCLQTLQSPNWLNFLYTELYNSSTPTPLECHVFDHHRAEIIVMQFTGHPLPVHQFVTVLWDFNPVRYCQPSLPTPTEYALPPSLEWHVWPGQRSIYNNKTQFLQNAVSPIYYKNT